MKTLLLLAAAGALALPAAADAQEINWDRVDQERYQACIDKTSSDAEEAYEDGLQWRGEGGGMLARHCIALALLQLGKTEEAAARLEEIGLAPDGGTAERRKDLLAQAGNAWLLARAPVEAERAFTQALLIAPGDPDVFIDRARAYALMENFDNAVRDLTTALSRRPDDSLALQLRADAHLELGDLEKAQSDVRRAVEIAPDDIDALLVRGRVREAIRTSR